MNLMNRMIEVIYEGNRFESVAPIEDCPKRAKLG